MTRREPRSRGLLAAAVLLALLAPGLAAAGEEASGSLVLQRTYIKTNDEEVQLGGRAPKEKRAFSPTKVLCPKHCVLRVELSTEILAFTNPNGIVLTVTAELFPPGKPASAVPLRSTESDDPPRNVKTFSWMVEDLAAGTHDVNLVLGLAASGSEQVFFSNRILTIEVYKKELVVKPDLVRVPDGGME